MTQPIDMTTWQNLQNEAPPKRMAKPTAGAPLTKLTDAEHEYLRQWLWTHTALNRLAHVEVEAAFARLEREASFILVKAGNDE